ncbi:MAG: phytoene desaturase family protein [Hyphomonadaceae bacterium]|nr:phytoene desaturase family protein [Hyphomonadaceae bacterium]
MLTLEVKRAHDAPAEDRRPHAIVIGAGFGGLAAAVRLGARGYRVTVLERRDACGGRAYVLKQDGFTFDCGPTIITAPFLFEDLWALCGRRFADDIDLRAMDPFYRLVFDDGETVTCYADHDAMRREIARIAPDDLAGYDRFLAHCAAIYRIGFERLGHARFDDWRAMARVAPDLLRLGGWRSVHGLVSHYIRNPRLRIALGFHPLFVGGDPFATTSVYCLINHLERAHGVHFAMGGTGALVRGLESLIAGQGGRIRCNADVAEIVIADGRAAGARLQSGETIAADIVVSNADAAHTYLKLLPKAAQNPITTERLRRSRYSMSLFVWYFGVRRRHESVAHHTIVLGPRYRGLIKDIFARKRLAPDMSLYLHRPTATDPRLAPDGCDAFYALSPVPNLDGAIDWRTEAEPYRRAIEARLEATVLPGLRGDIVTSAVMTPLDFRDVLLSEKGAAFGFEPILTQSAWFRPHNRSGDVPGLYLVGAGTHPGAGVPGVLSSARVLDAVVSHAADLARS